MLIGHDGFNHFPELEPDLKEASGPVRNLRERVELGLVLPAEPNSVWSASLFSFHKGSCWNLLQAYLTQNRSCFPCGKMMWRLVFLFFSQMSEDTFTYVFTLLYTPAPLGNSPIVRGREVSVSIQCHYQRLVLRLVPAPKTPAVGDFSVIYKVLFWQEEWCEQWAPETNLDSVQFQQKFRGKSLLLPETHDW